MGELGTHLAIERASVGNSPPKVIRAAFLPDEASTAEAVQQAITQGTIPDAYQADPQQVIQELKRLRATEVTSYLQ
jgi:hypothetical protein